AQRRLHRIEARGLGVDRDRAELARARDPGREPLRAAHDLITGAVDLGVARGCDAGGHERLRRELPLRRRRGGASRNPVSLAPARYTGFPSRRGGGGGAGGSGVCGPAGPVGARRSPLSRAGGKPPGALSLPSGSISPASTPETSAPRRVSVANSIALRNAIRRL